MRCVCPESGDEYVDIDQHGMLTICQHEMTESSANFREQKKTEKAQWNNLDPGKKHSDCFTKMYYICPSK